MSQRVTLAAIVAIAAVTENLRAQPPTYQTLNRPPMVSPAPTIVRGPLAAPRLHPHAAPVEPPAFAEPVHAQPYAYGWFGAPPRRHWSRHFGFYRNYTEWSAR